MSGSLNQRAHSAKPEKTVPVPNFVPNFVANFVELSGEVDKDRDKVFDKEADEVCNAREAVKRAIATHRPPTLVRFDPQKSRSPAE
jgi:hypothetical protein